MGEKVPGRSEGAAPQDGQAELDRRDCMKGLMRQDRDGQDMC